MGYQKDLDKYTDEELQHELSRRVFARARGLCDYCNRPPTTNPCKFPERHNHPILTVKSEAK